MSSVTPEDPRRRRRTTTAIKDSLRALSIQLALLNRRVGTRVAVRDGDLECLDLINRYGPLSPSGLARHAGLHPATVTGVVDRLERGGWITRERDPADRRAILLQVDRTRAGEILGQYAGMNSALDAICADYDAEQLAVVLDFLQRTERAGRAATDSLGADEK